MVFSILLVVSKYQMEDDCYYISFGLCAINCVYNFIKNKIDNKNYKQANKIILT